MLFYMSYLSSYGIVHPIFAIAMGKNSGSSLIKKKNQ